MCLFQAFYRTLGRFQEAALIQFQLVANYNKYTIDIKKQRLKKVYSDYFCKPISNSFYASQVANYINLLEMQIAEKSLMHPHDVIDKTVLNTLYYVCEKYKWTDSNNSNNLLNPYKLSETHCMLPAQFEWVSLIKILRSSYLLVSKLLFYRLSSMKEGRAKLGETLNYYSRKR